MRKVITYGTFDYFHYGHFNFLKQAKAQGDYLIVGVSSDKLCLEKGKVCLLDEDIRMSIIKELKFVDEVIIENSFDQKIDDVEKYDINVYCDGEDYKDIFPQTDAYKKLITKGCDIVFLKRTHGVSSSQLKDNLSKQSELDKNKGSIRSITNDLRKDNFND